MPNPPPHQPPHHPPPPVRPGDSPSAVARAVLGLPEPTAPSTLREAGRGALARVGGPVGLAAAAAPTVAFVVADATAGLGTAFVALGATAVLACTVRLVRRESPGAALAGLLLAGVCAAVAALVGEARAFFLPTTVLPALFVLAYTVSMLARRPLTSLVVHPLSGGPRDWRHHPGLAPVYGRIYWISSAAGLALAAANLVTRVGLYLADEPAALAAVQIVSTPVFAAHFVLTLAVARRAAAPTPAPAHP